MLFSERSIWTMVHGIGLGGAALLGLAAALFYLYAARPVVDPTGNETGTRAFAMVTVLSAVMLWLTVIIGTYFIFPPYRATPPPGTTDLSQFPRALVLANPSTAWLHAFAMEIKEQMPWIASMHTTAVAVTTGVLVMALPTSPRTFGVPGEAEAAVQKSMIAVPQSLEAEHHGIHEALLEATRVPGRVGPAAKELAAVLDPHFERENEIALPPLGLLAPLAAGKTPAGQQEALAMTDALRKEMPRMLEEHKRIRAATEKLRAVAREEKAAAQEQFAERLAAHAQTEEEILYPAAILVGDVIRARMAKK